MKKQSNINLTIAGGQLPAGFSLDAVTISQAIWRHTEISLSLGVADGLKLELNKHIDKYLGRDLVVATPNGSSEKGNGTEAKFQCKLIEMDAENEQFELRGISESIFLETGLKSRGFVNKEIKQIVHRVLDQSNIKSKIKDPPNSLKLPYVAQYEESDLGFLRRLASYDGCVLYHDGEDFIFTPQLNNGAATVVLKRQDMNGWDGSVSLSLFPTSGKAFAHGHLKPLQEGKSRQVKPTPSAGGDSFRKVFSAARQLFDPQVLPMHGHSVYDDTVEQWLNNQLNGSLPGMYVVSATTGLTTLKVGQPIQFKDHPFLSGTFVIIQMTMIYRRGRYQTSFRAVPDGLGGSAASQTGQPVVSLPAIVLDNKDPENLGRVQVCFPWDDPQDKANSPWVAIANAAASGNQGVAFTPQIDDNVLVTFQKGDPSLPVIVGALYHQKNKPQFQTPNGAEEMTLSRTKNGTLIRVVDKAGEEEITIQMKDAKNLFRMTLGKNPEITVETTGKMTLKAKEVEVAGTDRLTLASKEVCINGNEKVIVSGKKIDASGDTIKLTGSQSIHLN